MGLFSSRNLRKAKSMLDKNRHKVGDLVDKATDQIDKVSKGKTSSVTAKIDEAAHSYSTGGATHHGEHPDSADAAAEDDAGTADDAAAADDANTADDPATRPTGEG